MYNKWFGVVIILAAAVVVGLALYVWKQWNTNKSDRVKNIVASAVVLIVIVTALVEVPDRLQNYELLHYEKLFRAPRVECNDYNITGLFHSYENECWNFREMENWTLEEPCGEIVGVICFYDEKQKLFQKINIIQLNESFDNQRTFHAEDKCYVFVSDDWESIGYVYGFSKELAEQLLLLC